MDFFIKLLSVDCVVVFFEVEEHMMNDAEPDRKLFRQISHHTHCLHPLLPQQRPRCLQQALRSRGHNYSLLHMQKFVYQ